MSATSLVPAEAGTQRFHQLLLGSRLRGTSDIERPPIHPGEILADELSEIGITPTELARQLEEGGEDVQLFS